MNILKVVDNWRDMCDQERDEVMEGMTDTVRKHWLEAVDCHRIVSELQGGVMNPYDAGGGDPKYQTDAEAREYAIEYWEGERDYWLKQAGK